MSILNMALLTIRLTAALMGTSDVDDDLRGSRYFILEKLGPKIHDTCVYIYMVFKP